MSMTYHFQNVSNFNSFGNIFPKLDFAVILIYTFIRGGNYDRKNRISQPIEKV